MRSSALRVEFVISGAASLLAAYALWLGARRLLAYGSLPLRDWLTFDPLGSTAEALLFVALFLGAAFVVGTLVVQVTFDLIAKPMRRKAEQEALSDLSALVPADREGVQTDTEQLVRIAMKEADDLQSKARVALADVGWLRMPPDVAREVEYRRANRQIFLGLLPAVAATDCAALMAVMRGHGPETTGVLVTGLLLVGILGGWRAFKGAKYQEQRIARLTLLAALIRETEETEPRFLVPPVSQAAATTAPA